LTWSKTRGGHKLDQEQRNGAASPSFLIFRATPASLSARKPYSVFLRRASATKPTSALRRFDYCANGSLNLGVVRTIAERNILRSRCNSASQLRPPDPSTSATASLIASRASDLRLPSRVKLQASVLAKTAGPASCRFADSLGFHGRSARFLEPCRRKQCAPTSRPDSYPSLPNKICARLMSSTGLPNELLGVGWVMVPVREPIVGSPKRPAATQALAERRVCQLEYE